MKTEDFDKRFKIAIAGPFDSKKKIWGWIIVYRQDHGNDPGWYNSTDHILFYGVYGAREVIGKARYDSIFSRLLMPFATTTYGYCKTRDEAIERSTEALSKVRDVWTKYCYKKNYYENVEVEII